MFFDRVNIMDGTHRFAHPFLAFMMFIPCGLVGLIIPRILWGSFPLSQDVAIVKRSKEVFQYIENMFLLVPLIVV